MCEMRIPGEVISVYKLTELRPEHFRTFYAQLRETVSTETKKPLSEYR